IDTIAQWNGTSFISSWGVTNTATYGQTITATNLNSKLNSFTFELSQTSGTPPNYQAFVYQWDPVNRHIVGPPLFTSAPLVAPTTANANTYTPVTINTGGIQLTPGQQYVLFFTTSSQTNGAGAAYRYGALTNDTTYAGGKFVFINNGSTNTPADFAAL